MQTSLRAIALASSFALVVACSSPSSSSRTAASDADATAPRASLLPPPSGPLELTVAGDGAITLEELLARVTKVTGVTFSIDSAASNQLKMDKVAISQTTRVPADDVYGWVESILQQNGYVLGVLSAGEAPLVGVYGSRTPRASQPPPISVPIESIGECRRHPALLVTTVVTLPNTDVRTLGNSLRGIASNPPESQGIFPIGNTSSLVLTGSGRYVADLVAMLRTVDARAGTAVEPAAASAAK